MKRLYSYGIPLFIAAMALTAHCGSNSEKKTEQGSEQKIAVVTVDSVTARAGDSLSVPIRLDNGEAIAGIQLKIQFDPMVMAVGKPRVTPRAAEMIVMDNVKENILFIMMYNMSRKNVEPGKGPILMIPLKISKGATGTSILEVKEALLARQDAQSVPSSSKSGKVVIRGH
jgi:hypothetical protein